MRIVIFGSGGMLGSYVLFYLKKVYPTTPIIAPSRDEFDVTIPFKMGIQEEDVVINCTGIINKRDDIVSRGGESMFLRESIRVNSIFPQLMSTICRMSHARFIHVTTDCVFDGIKGLYSISDDHTATDIYGITKSCGEPSSDECILIRTSIIGESKNGRSLVEWLRSSIGKTITGYTNHRWNGVTCLELAKYIENLIICGVRHGMFVLTSPDIVTKYELCKTIIDVYGWTIDLQCGDDIRTIDRSLTGTVISDTPLVEQIREMEECDILNRRR